MSVRIQCPAKINLHLEILGKRGDGFHELRTIFAAIGVWDVLEIEDCCSENVELRIEGVSSLSTGPDNLVMRAAQVLKDRSNVQRGASITLTKRIPIAGGLGGGSSDAAATLFALDALWGCETPLPLLHHMAEELGADVAFFLVGGIAWGVGKGGELYPLPDLPDWWIVLLPGIEPVPTKNVYQALAMGGLDRGADPELYHWAAFGGRLPVSMVRNDLQNTVIRLWPEVGRRLDLVRQTEPMAAMVSGSGGSVYGLFASQKEAEHAATALATHGAMAVPLLGREQSRLRLTTV